MGEHGWGGYILRNACVSDCQPFSQDSNRFGRVFDSLVIGRGLTPHVAWRVAFVAVPFVIVTATGLGILFLCPDTPTGPWKDRHITRIIDAVEVIHTTKEISKDDTTGTNKVGREMSADSSDVEKRGDDDTNGADTGPVIKGTTAIYDTTDERFAEAAIIKPPTVREILRVVLTFQTIMQCALYFVTFGGELAINSNLSSFYIKESGKPPWAQTLAANWAAMYGMLNLITRPLGGYIGDLIYPIAGIEGKRIWQITCKISSQCNGF